MNSWLYLGEVYHQRFFPREHRLSMKLFYICFPLSRISELSNKIFSVNRWNLLSFYTKDHGDRQNSDLGVDLGGALRSWALAKLRSAGLTYEITEIELQTMPRVFGFVFNPVSFWYCYHGRELVATIAEVNNTFGQTHSYVIPSDQMAHKKVLQVSPFNKIEGQYIFSILKTSEKNEVIINYKKEARPLLMAKISGQAMAWTIGNLFKAWWAHPLMTFMAVFYIHLHALILYFKGVPFFGKKGI